MRITFNVLFIIIVVFVLERVISLALKGDLFKPGALQRSFHELGQTVWLGMRLFVIFWILYLALLYYVQHRQ